MLDPAQKEAFWPNSATGWVGLVGAALGVVAGAAVVVGWVWPWIRRRLRMSSWQDIRVRVAVVRPLEGPKLEPGSDCLRVRVENHSNRDFHLSGVTVHEGGRKGTGLWSQRDANGSLNVGGTIRAGDSYDYYMPIEAVTEGAKVEACRYRYGVATDKIGREYRSPRGALRKALQEYQRSLEGLVTSPSEPSPPRRPPPVVPQA